MTPREEAFLRAHEAMHRLYLFSPQVCGFGAACCCDRALACWIGREPTEHDLEMSLKLDKRIL
jgi:hypothetical protein